MSMKKLPLDDLIGLMETEQQRVCRAVIADYNDVIFDLPGSTAKHQAWPGGYISHLEESLNIAIILYESLNARRPLPFKQSDVLFALFLHDFDKLLRYEKVDGSVKATEYTGGYAEQVAELLGQNYHYKLSAEHSNAIKYAHGEGKDYHPTDRVIMPLGTLVHCCDIISARIWFDKGKSHSSWID